MSNFLACNLTTCQTTFSVIPSPQTVPERQTQRNNLPVEMSAALIRTLSAIAIKQPIPQSEIIRIRGAGAYEHIKELAEKELIAKRDDQGSRSPILSTTKKFQEYFRLTRDGKELRNLRRCQWMERSVEVT